LGPSANCERILKAIDPRTGRAVSGPTLALLLRRVRNGLHIPAPAIHPHQRVPVYVLLLGRRHNSFRHLRHVRSRFHRSNQLIQDEFRHLGVQLGQQLQQNAGARRPLKRHR